MRRAQKIQAWLSLITVLLIFAFASGSEYEIELEEDKHWCDQIANGTWYASQDEIAQRCGTDGK